MVLACTAGWGLQVESRGPRRTPHLTVQVQGLPHQWQSDEFLGALAPGP